MTYKLQPGINYCTNDQYHSDKEYLSSSKLKLLLKSAEEFHREQVSPSPAAKSSALDLGTYLHSLVLEPAQITTEYAVYPGFRRAGKEFEKFKALHADKQIISLSMQNTGQRLAASLQACKPTLELFKGGEAELSIAGQICDVAVKARFDYINISAGYIVDLKSSREPTGREYFKQTIKDYSYDLSAALYCLVAEMFFRKSFDFYWTVVSKSDIDCRSYKASASTRNKGLSDVVTALEKYKQCIKSGIWLDSAPSSATINANQEIEEI